MIAAVGKPRNAAIAAAIQDYERRAARYWPLEIREVREEPARSTAAAVVREREAERLDGRFPPNGLVVACDERGRSLGSEEFAAILRDHRDRGVSLAFVIGGAFGLSPGLLARCAFSLALAPWTLPHELARLVLVEQLYRAGTIVRREPYHK